MKATTFILGDGHMLFFFNTEHHMKILLMHFNWKMMRHGLCYYCFAEHVCAVATTCSARASDAWYGRATANGRRLCSSTANGRDGNAPNAAVRDAPNGKLLMWFSSWFSCCIMLVWFWAFPPDRFPFPRVGGRYSRQTHKFAGIYVARHVDNLSTKYSLVRKWHWSGCFRGPSMDLPFLFFHLCTC